MTEPDLVVGSPMCKEYSPWQRLNEAKEVLQDARLQEEALKLAEESPVVRGKVAPPLPGLLAGRSSQPTGMPGCSP